MLGGGCIIELIKQLSGIAIEKGSKDSYGIPIILGDIVAKSLMLKRSELKSSLFVKKVNDLPKEYKIQLLAAFIVDEGSISKSSIKVCNTNLLILKSLRKIMLSLGYNCSKVKNYGDHVGGEIFIKYRKARINYQIYNLYMHADGLLKFKKDLDIMIKKYGNIAGLWQKQDILSKFSLKVDLNKINKSRISKKHLIPLIEKEITKGPIFIKEFAKRNDLDYIRAYKLFFRLKEKGKIKKVSPGMFVSKDYNGPIDFTLKSKIEKLLKEEFSLKEITSLTNANLKSVSAQLSRFCNEGKIKRIKCGIYSLS
ncbi:MAG: hypothetical protein ABIJ20_04685 [Nanoarchaeota archaeon]|nr:hypothetical protein [Nanoarchaeota archaeon]MBU1445102.1 hypothetical protein [Nanoarchaeota archaeon]MBU2406988.1 hypothetical protein [Nanoarchaeota archaeon]MBU2420357.1 hypothetical protein [Nanoarchaeota archaeon]MBU2474965.1 hypothetical protein [Nanoarchaeota archaeon]